MTRLQQVRFECARYWALLALLDGWRDRLTVLYRVLALGYEENHWLMVNGRERWLAWMSDL